MYNILKNDIACKNGLKGTAIWCILYNIENQIRFSLDNLQLQNNLIRETLEKNAIKFAFLGSTCSRRKLSLQSFNHLFLASLDCSNEGYAFVKKLKDKINYIY